MLLVMVDLSWLCVCKEVGRACVQGNLRQALDKMDELQIDDDGRGLVLTYDGNSGLMVVVDKQLLFYRKYASVHWPWEQMVASNDEKETLTFGGEK